MPANVSPLASFWPVFPIGILVFITFSFGRLWISVLTGKRNLTDFQGPLAPFPEIGLSHCPSNLLVNGRRKSVVFSFFA